MHPVIIEQVAADHIRDIHTEAAAERRARQARQARRARRHAPSARPELPASETLSYDPRLDAGQQPIMDEQPSAPPVPVATGARWDTTEDHPGSSR
jgi:hypothetical protein